jgi:hypothetical protein
MSTGPRSDRKPTAVCSVTFLLDPRGGTAHHPD